jgi:hypothetical protein
MSAITLIGAVSEPTISQAIDEINSIDWNDTSLGELLTIEVTDKLKIILLSRLDEMRNTITEINETVISDPVAPVLYPNIYSLIEWVKNEIGASFLGKARIVSLLPGKDIPDHVNDSLYYSKYTRYHIPLVTHPDVKIVETLTSEEENMTVGNIYKLSNTKSHSFINKSNISRIHLIIDLA